MPQLTITPIHNGRRSLGVARATSVAARAPHGSVPSADRLLDEVESVARIGSYSLDILAGRWTSSKGLDAIFGIDAGFDRSVEGWVSLVHPAERVAMVAYLTDEVLGRGRPFDKQYRIVRADTGEERWVHGRGALEFDGSGRPLRMFGTIADVTDQRRAQEAVIASELRYAAIFEGTAEAILIAEVATRRFRWVNAAGCALLGYTRDELLQMTLPDLHPAQDLPWILQLFEADVEGRVSEARSVPCVRKDGSVVLADIRGSTAVVDGVACNISFFTDVTERVAAEEERARLVEGLRQSEQNLAEAQRIAHIGSWERDLATGAVHWSDESCRLLGIEPGTFAGTLEAYLAFVHPDDRTKAAPSRADLVAGDHRTVDYRIVRADGAVRFLHEEAEVIGDASRTPVRYVGSTQDITERVAAEEERARLDEELRRSQRNLAEAQRIAHIGSWEWDLATDKADRSEELHRIYAVEPGTIPGTTEAFHAFVHPDDRARVQASEREAITSGGRYALEYRAVRPDGSIRLLHDEAEVIRDEHGAPVRLIGIVQDITERVAAEAERKRLVAAVEQTSDSVIIADLAGTIEYVNPAFELVSGYRRDEVIGQDPRILKRGRQAAAFYRALRRCLTRGQTWTGTLTNRRKDGSLYEEEATISPIRSPGGEITGYVAVKRDVTALRAAESGLSREFRERSEVAAALARLQPSGSAEGTATAICDGLLSLPGIDVVGVINFLDPQRAVPLAVGGPDGLPFAAGRPLPDARATYLYERASQGPWAEASRPRSADGPYGEAMAEIGIRAIAYAPIRNGHGLLGVVAAGTLDEAYARHLIDRLPAVVEFAASASALLSRQLERGHRDDLLRERARRTLAEGGLRPVFQPIVGLGSRTPIGYEALTRFADGTPPDRMIAEAHSVGLGLELEVACLAAALAAAEALPADGWLSLNASPDVLLHPTALPGLLAGRSRRFVLEVTEHAEIADYAALRRAIAGFGPTVSLAVDDAGAGFASLRHVVELAPRYLKLDIGLVRHVDRDPTRQAMIAGLAHFAARAGCQVIAEGIEEPAELDMLHELGVPFGQGYLLGRPEPLPAPSGQHQAIRAGN